MKKFTILFLTYVFFIVLFGVVEVKAIDSSETDYQSFVEIIMSSGKLLKNFTQAEIDELMPKTDGCYFFSAVAVPVSKNVQASYISNTLLSIHNTSSNDINYDFDFQIETNNKVSFSSSGQISGGGSIAINKIKAEASSKSGVELSNTTTTSKKEKRSMKLVIEPGCRCIVYLTGNISINNGVVAYYTFFYRTLYGGYEFATIESQYPKMEKVKV